MSEEDVIRENLIQRLWLGKATHASLTQLFEASVVEKPVFSQILSQLTTFSEASGFQQGGFTLKPEFNKCVMLHWPFYRTEDQQKAQEKYHEYQDIEAKKQSKTLSDMNHLPLPPLKPFLPCFSFLGEMYRSQTLHQVFYTVFSRVRSADKSNFTPAMLDICLHIMQLALLESTNVSDDFLSAGEKFNGVDSIISLLDAISKDTNFVRSHSAIRWIFQQLSKNSALSDMIKGLQVPQIIPQRTAEEEREYRRQRALEARKKATEKVQASAQKVSEKIASEKTETEEKDDDEEKFVECILCHENSNNFQTNPYGAVSFVQSSNIKRLTEIPTKERKLKPSNGKVFPPNVSSCGHLIHFGCYDKHISSLQTKLRRDRYFAATTHLNLERGDFECPLCKQVSNCIVPYLPPTEMKKFEAFNINQLTQSFISNTFVFEQHKDPISKEFLESSRLQEMLSGMANRVCCVYENSLSPSSGDHGWLLCTLKDAIQYTIANLEIAARLPKSPILGYSNVDWGISIKSKTKSNFLKFFEATLAFHFGTGFQLPGCFKGYQQLHELLISGITAEGSVCFLTQNMTDVLLSWIVSYPLISGNCRLDSIFDTLPALINLMTQASLVQSVVSLQVNSKIETPDQLQSTLTCQAEFNAFSTTISEILGGNGGKCNSNDVLLMCLPFLRQTAILFAIISTQELPSVSNLPLEEEYHLLLKFLGMPELKSYFNISNESQLGSLVNRWCKGIKEFEKIQQVKKEKLQKELEQPLKPNDLSIRELKKIFTDNNIDFSGCLEKSDMVALFESSGLTVPKKEPVIHPDLVDWKDLVPKFLEVNRFELFELKENYIDLVLSFPEMGKTQPVVCLICGSLLVAGERLQLPDGSMVGRLTHHCETCGGGQVMYLELQDALILAQTFHGLYELPTPYLDQHGQAVKGLKRGRTLTLRRDRYERLRSIFVLHQIGLVESVPLAINGTGVF